MREKNKQIKQINELLPKLANSQRALDLRIEQAENLSNECADMQIEIDKLNEKIANPAKIALTQEQFLNLAKSASDKMRAGNPVEKDRLARILFLNLRINDERTPSYLWKEPFASMINSVESRPGGRSRLEFEPIRAIAAWLMTCSNTKAFRWNNELDTSQPEQMYFY